MSPNTQKLFIELSERLHNDADKARAIGARITIQLAGENGGEWFIDASPTGPRVVTGKGDGEVLATVTFDTHDFLRYCENPRVNGTELVMTGKVRITGDMAAVGKLEEIFEI